MLRVNCEAVMWKITTRGFTLEEVVIMAVMNLLTSVDRLPNARTGVVEMKRRSRMDLNSIKRTILAAVGVLALSSVNAVAQEIRSAISLQGTGFFTKDADGNGIRQHATDTGGFLVGYRYNFNRWLAAEANYGYDRNTQIYFGGTGARVESNIHQITGSAVVNLASFARLQPYALAGGGALVFDPTGNAEGNFAGATTETRGRIRLRRSCRLRFHQAHLVTGRVPWLRIQSTRFQSRGLEYRQLDAYGATVSRHRLPLLISRGLRRGTGVQPNTRATSATEKTMHLQSPCRRPACPL